MPLRLLEGQTTERSERIGVADETETGGGLHQCLALAAPVAARIISMTGTRRKVAKAAKEAKILAAPATKEGMAAPAIATTYLPAAASMIAPPGLFLAAPAIKEVIAAPVIATTYLPAAAPMMAPPGLWLPQPQLQPQPLVLQDRFLAVADACDATATSMIAYLGMSAIDGPFKFYATTPTATPRGDAPTEAAAAPNAWALSDAASDADAPSAAAAWADAPSAAAANASEKSKNKRKARKRCC